jgi:hypothetical protein
VKGGLAVMIGIRYVLETFGIGKSLDKLLSYESASH